MKHKKPPCATCKRPVLLLQNQFVYLLFSKYLNLFIDSTGGISVEGIHFVIDIENIHPEDRPLITRKISAYISTALKTKQETKHG